MGTTQTRVMSPKLFSLATLMVGTLVIACSAGSMPSASSPTEQLIREARERFNRAIAERDVSAIETIIGPGYHSLSSLNNHTHGLLESRDGWSALFARDTSESYVRTTRELRVNEAWGHAEELGNWEGRRSQDAGGVRVFGTYSAKWIRRNSTWTLQSEVFTLLGCEGAPAACAPPSEEY